MESTARVLVSVGRDLTPDAARFCEQAVAAVRANDPGTAFPVVTAGANIPPSSNGAIAIMVADSSGERVIAAAVKAFAPRLLIAAGEDQDFERLSWPGVPALRPGDDVDPATIIGFLAGSKCEHRLAHVPGGGPCRSSRSCAGDGTGAPIH